ncbi:MAG: DUF3097 domain-containing protein [Frankia sp.]|nr:DUF3097 domain-containing protein [Frankia sp.]
MRSRDYGPDVLAQPSRRAPAPPPTVEIERDMVVEDPVSGFCGAVVGLEADGVILEDRFGTRRVFPLETGAFLLEGRRVTLVRPRPRRPAAPARTASGSIAVPNTPARVARASRIYVEGLHDAELVERVWGDDLRVEGVVVEPLDGADQLPGLVAAFRPGPGRRLGVLLDHLVPGSKESRIAAEVAGEHVLVTGHPYVDIWQAVKPSALGIPAWPQVPRGESWKDGVCRALGVPDTATMWRRVQAAVRSYTDLEVGLLRAVEELIDFVTAD